MKRLGVLTKWKSPEIIFLIVVLIATISLIGATLNYIEFYTSIERLDLTILNVSPSIQQNEANITFALAIENPTSYTGLMLKEMAYSLYVELDGENLELAWDTVLYSDPIPIVPGTTTPLEHTFNLNVDLEPTKRFIEFHQTHQGNAKWLLKCGALLSTFIGKIEVPLTAHFP